MTDDVDLPRFLDAQQGVYRIAIEELKAGRKESHWMWFVFPQIASLGRSRMARRYAIASLAEARAYLAHPVLDARLRAAATALLPHRERGAEAVLGTVDAMKLRSSMTLFEVAALDPAPFAAVLDAFFGGERDQATLDILAKQA